MNELVHIFKKRKTTRNFSKCSIDISLIKSAIEIASSAPSGANRQPWHFVVVENNEIKELIRRKAEEEEFEFYNKKSTSKWVSDLQHLHTNHKKKFITDASYLIVVFYKNYEIKNNQEKNICYYAKESAGIATGMLLASLHLVGLSTLTYTPTNRKFLTHLLKRESNENPMMVVAVGLPDESAMVPVLTKKSLLEVMSIYSDIKPR
jgi:nitroreductase